MPCYRLIYSIRTRTKKQLKIKLMKLLLNKKGNKGTKTAVNGVTVNQSSVYIKGTAFDRLVKKDTPIYGNLGINNEGNLCLYISYENNDLLYRFYVPKSRLKEVRFGLNTKEQKTAISPYAGKYHIKFVCLKDVNGITEVVLQKM